MFHPRASHPRSRFKQTRVTGHLRTQGEGTEVGFTKPRTQHSFVGMPSATISAAVAGDRVIMWHVVDTSWNGAAAAHMYQNALLPALRRTWGERRHYLIIEDGDRKGNQSNRGLRAKEKAHIRALTLPPRSPCWMPLDYAIWAKIVDKVVDTAPAGVESKKAFLERLRKCAKTLPKGFVARSIQRMPKNIQGVIQMRGYNPKRD